jgi:hypothetical protein
MRSIYNRPQSLPISIFRTNASELHHQGRILPDLQEEIYSHPEIKERASIDKSSDSPDNEKLPSILATSQQSTSSKPIPFAPLSRETERENELYEELVHVYNDATWQMYHRIQKARQSRSRYERPRSVSEGYSYYKVAD